MDVQLQKQTRSPVYVGQAARRIIALRRAAERMLAELESSRLEVVLIPSKVPDCAMRGGMIRAVQEANPEWYQDFCSQFTARRRAQCRRCYGRCECSKEERQRLRWRTRPRRLHDTLIKRANTIKGLKELMRGQCETIYAQRLTDFIEQRLVNKRAA